MEREVDLLWPLVTATRVLSAFVVGVVLVGAVAAIFGSGSVLGLGDDSVCVSTSQLPVHGRAIEDIEAENRQDGIVPGVSRVADSTYLCRDHPGAGARALAFLAVAPEFFLLLGFSGGVGLLVRRARGHGLFSAPVVGVVSLLGWWVLAGELVVATVQALANSGLVTRLVPAHQWFDVLPYWHTTVTGLLAGAGILTIARVMRIAVGMRAELDVTI